MDALFRLYTGSREPAALGDSLGRAARTRSEGFSNAVEAIVQDMQRIFSTPFRNSTNPTISGVFSIDKPLLLVGLYLENRRVSPYSTTTYASRRVATSGYREDLKNPTPVLGIPTPFLASLVGFVRSEKVVGTAGKPGRGRAGTGANSMLANHRHECHGRQPSGKPLIYAPFSMTVTVPAK
ncbi:MAG: hypothetical protein M3N10_10575 [Actinomycetota bacterium]|nr:hypothetical protein [Actinomycetota bacterium]